MPTPKLKPCPFCGSKSLMMTINFKHVPPMFRCCCKRCGCGTPWLREDYKNAVEIWNSRNWKEEQDGK